MRPRYEIEFTPVESSEPEWSREVDDARFFLERYWGIADTHAVLDAADASWSGGVGPWQTLFPGDRV